MNKIAIVTDSNSGISQEEASKLGVFVIPMPVIIGNNTYYEGININRDDFFKKLSEDIDITTSQPLPGDLMELWNDLLRDFDSLIYIPMSSSLSGSFQTSSMLASDFDNRVYVVNNQRISVSQRQSVIDALEMVEAGLSPLEIKNTLEEDKYNSSIYITVDTLEHLKKGGRITPAVAAIGSKLRIKPVLEIQGDKLDSYSRTRTMKNAKKIMIDAVKKDISNRFNSNNTDDILLQIAHINKETEAKILKEELEEIFPECPIYIGDLPLSISSHIGESALAIGCIKKLKTQIPANKYN